RAGRGTGCPVAGTRPDAARALENDRGAGLARSSAPHSRAAVVVGPAAPAQERGHAGGSLAARWVAGSQVRRAACPGRSAPLRRRRSTPCRADTLTCAWPCDEDLTPARLSVAFGQKRLSMAHCG